MSSAIWSDKIQPSGVCVHGVPSEAVVSLITTTICPHDNGPTDAAPLSGWVYSVVLSTVTRDCHGGPKRLASTLSTPTVSQVITVSRASNRLRIRSFEGIGMLYCITDMRVAGVEPSPLRRLFPLLLLLVLLGAVVALALWARQQDTARRLAENRADLAESQLVAAQASLTAIARVSAAATATATAASNEPELALRRALDLVFEAYKGPN